MLKIHFVFALILLVFESPAQKLKKADKQLRENLEAHVKYLADDRLEGRRTGTAGEAMAMTYISSQFNAIGLLPKGTAGYFQPFEVDEGLQVKETTYFIINDSVLKLEDEFFPFSFSAAKKLQASPAVALQEPGMPWFVDLKEILDEHKGNPHFDLEDYIRTNSIKAQKRDATAIIIYNTSGTDDHLAFNPMDRSEPLPIPVIYVRKEVADRFFHDPTATVHLKINVEIGEKKRKGHNVIGYLDNGAPNTVILGAHFDHLGYGEDGNSLFRTGEKMVHNGADDNASGTAALIELARLLKESKSKNNNYLFIAFSGEELGLFGSKHYTEHPTVPLENSSYMINMDMVGRLNDSSRVLAIGGYGTSPRWSEVINPRDRKSPFVIRLDSSGAGPSDHTSFYRKGIPVLFFFTGQHKDYHRPGDDAEKINYDGELKIVRYIQSLITSLNKQPGKLPFTSTREPQVSLAPFKVTLGIMPDYTYAGSGVRADGVTEGRPAFKAGLKAGDVIIALGENKIGSLEHYMQALNKFNKGDKTKVRFRRGNETIESDIQF